MILVTGGVGFIGSNLVGSLADEGARICVCDTSGPGDKWRNVARHEIAMLVHPKALTDCLVRRGSEIECVFHMGAITSTTEMDEKLLRAVNVELPQELWRWCAAREVPLIYASSAATYGSGSEGFVDADDPVSLSRLRPLNPYGASKHAFDVWVADQVANGRPTPPHWHGLKFFNVYGPNEYHKGEMMSLVAKSYATAHRGEPVRLFRSHDPAYDDGGQLRDFVHVDDCVEVMRWLQRTRPESGIYNVGTGRARSWLALMRALYDAVDQPLEVEWVDIPAPLRGRYQYFTEADMTKLVAVGHAGSFRSIEDGVRSYVDDFLARDDPYR